mmetsp:Transcript_34439/g.83323  ORF Transcript_34439/g.83323 Transcript_34439/m.83323 type:complete len:609 (+) Transcript_34439:28-1854(+)
MLVSCMHSSACQIGHKTNTYQTRSTMASTQPHTMSDSNSIGTYDSLFDDDVGTLGSICFDLDIQQVAQSGELQLCHASSWCKSSSSSCCSLCRLPAVSMAGEDEDSVAFGLGLPNDASSLSRPRAVGVGGTSGQAGTCNDKLLHPRGSCDQCKPPSVSNYADCNGNNVLLRNISRQSCQCGDLFLPVKSISIPRSYIASSAALSLSAVDEVKLKAAVESNNGRDYLSASFLPDDALCHIVKFLNVPSLVQLRECNRKLCDVASKNTAGWTDHCAKLWSVKANVCSAARDMLAGSSRAQPVSQRADEASSGSKYASMEAYKLSVADAASREEISYDEICFDASPDREGSIWSFRFKESAGRDWTSWDPWWNRQQSRKLVFLRDGTIMQAHPKGLEAGSRTITTSAGGTRRLYDVFSERTVRREADGEEVPAPRIEMMWRFVDRPLDLPVRPAGAYVRINVGGRDVPTYLVRRSPTGNWGFVLESCWGVYASFELAPRVPPRSTGPTQGGGRGRRRLRRTRNGDSRWVNVEDSDDDNDRDVDEGGLQRERMRNVRRRIDLFVEESAMIQNGHSQWREALLYNIGAVTLPEGNGDAMDEFDNAWQNAMMRT